MDKEKAKELAKILLAYSEGKRIEVSNNNNSWIATSSLELITTSKYVRIKLAPKLIPFTFEDNLIGQCLITKASKNRSLIIGQLYDGVYIGTKTITTRYVDLLKDFEFEDGSAFGKYINE